MSMLPSQAESLVQPQELSLSWWVQKTNKFLTDVNLFCREWVKTFSTVAKQAEAKLLSYATTCP